MKKQQKQDQKRQKREAKKKQRQVAKEKTKEANKKEKEARHKLKQEATKKPQALGPEKKRRQHYVWQHYLRSWTIDGKLWCQKDKRRSSASTKGIAHERDFYRLKELSDADLRFVDALVIKPTQPHLREINRHWVSIFRKLFDLQRSYNASGHRDEGIETKLDIAINNLEEDLHGAIENEAGPLLAALKRGDASVFEDGEKFAGFAAFVSFQHMRTPKIMKESLEVGRLAPGFNIEAAWGLMRTILATNLGAGLATRREVVHVTFLESGSSSEFITGDQPTVNVRARGLSPGIPPTELELYYPLSPTRALLVAFDGATPRIDRRRLSDDETLAYNRMIVEASDKQIYAATEQALIAASS